MPGRIFVMNEGSSRDSVNLTVVGSRTVTAVISLSAGSCGQPVMFANGHASLRSRSNVNLTSSAVTDEPSENVAWISEHVTVRPYAVALHGAAAKSGSGLWT